MLYVLLLAENLKRVYPSYFKLCTIFTEQLQLSIVKGNKQPSVRLQLLRIMHISMAKIDLLALRFPIEIFVGICVGKNNSNCSCD